MRKALCALLAVPLLAAAPPRPVIPTLGETIEVSIVNVDVVVTDREGRRIHGLTANDFEIFENGRRQPVSNFAEYRSDVDVAATSLEARREQAPPPSQHRTLVLFLEPFRLQPFRTNAFVSSVKTLVRNTIRKGDSVSLVEFERKAVIRVAPTDDVAEIDAALDSFAKRCTGGMFDPTAAVEQMANAIRELEANIDGRSGTHSPIASSAGDAARLEALRALVEMKRRVDSINAILQSLAGVEGKKMLLLAPHRLGRLVGTEYYDAASANIDRTEFDNTERLESIARNANAAGVVVYPMYVPGLDEQDAQGGGHTASYGLLSNEIGGMAGIAEKTGGVSTWDANEIAAVMPQVAADAQDYYSLAYRVTTRREDAARRIEVKTKNPDYRIRARQQFVEKSDDTRMRDRVVALLRGLSVEPAFRIAAAAKPVRKSGRRELLPLRVQIPVSALTAIPVAGGKFSGAFSVYLAAAGELSDMSDVARQTQPFSLTPEQMKDAAKGHFTYDAEMNVSSNADHVAVGVLDEVSKSFGVTTLKIER